MHRLKFRIYYDGGATYDGDPFDAPAWGALAIVQEHKEHGREIVSNKDYFVWMNSRWMGVDWIGMIDYLQQNGARKVLFGRMVPNDHFNDITKLANEDEDFPIRTAWGVYENKVE